MAAPVQRRLKRLIGAVTVAAMVALAVSLRFGRAVGRHRRGRDR